MDLISHVDDFGNAYWFKTKPRISLSYWFYSIKLSGDIDEIWKMELPGLLHNDEGPAVIFSSGQHEWWSEGVLHRRTGPAIEFPNGLSIWFWYGHQVSSDDWICRLWRDFLE